MAGKMHKRALNETFLNEFLYGKLNPLLKIIQKDNDLIMCLRGDCTMVYYKCAKILEIPQTLKGFKVDKNYGIAQPNLETDWVEYFKDAKYKIDSYSWNEDENEQTKQQKLEKEVQQLIFRENSYSSESNTTDYFVFDMEYQYCRDTNARFDALAIFWPRKSRKPNYRTQLAIIEVKAKLDSISGKASVSKHYNDVSDFINNINLEEAKSEKEAFFEDMKTMFIQMKELGFININANPENISIDQDNVQLIFAISNYNDNSVKLQKEIDEITKMQKNAEYSEYEKLEPLFATSPCLGYGLYEKSMLSVDEIKNKLPRAKKKSKLIIHRGTNEIGGSAVEINNGNIRVLFDFGVPLDSMDRKEWTPEDYKLPISGLYKDEKPEFNAIFLTHAHPDHYGLLQLVNPDIPIYMSKITYDILKKISPLLPRQNTNALNLNIIENEITFGDNITVKAHNVDHSIAGACAYEIKTDNKTIVYTGDIRFHGRISWQSFALGKDIKKPDYLIMEGTTLGRPEQNIVNEEDLEKEFARIFENEKLPLVQFSPQNLSRLVTIYRACLQTNRTLVIDAYTAYVLEIYSSISKNIPQYNWKNIMVNFAKSSINDKLAESEILFKYKTKKISVDEIVAEPQKYVVKGNGVINRQIISRISKEQINIIFSMWKGYLDKPSWFDNYKDIIIPLHTSGHAYIEHLQKLIEQMQPKNLIPIHTEFKSKFKKFFDSNVIELDDGQEYPI